MNKSDEQVLAELVDRLRLARLNIPGMTQDKAAEIRQEEAAVL